MKGRERGRKIERTSEIERGNEISRTVLRRASVWWVPGAGAHARQRMYWGVGIVCVRGGDCIWISDELLWCKWLVWFMNLRI